MAGESRLDASRVTVAAPAAQGCVPSHRPGVGAKGDGLEALGLRERRLGEEGVAVLGRACVVQQARAAGACGADGQEAPRGHPERGDAEGDERGGGVDERADPADQGDGLWVPKP